MKWAVILAGGRGSRLQLLTRTLTGDDRPKQFCSLFGGETLLAQTRRRLLGHIDAARSLCVVTREHERFYRSELCDMTPVQLVQQPADVGTAAAIAYGVGRVGRYDSKAIVGFYPADHLYEDAGTFLSVVDQTYRKAQQCPDRVFLLGTVPDGPEIECGWIEPGPPLGGPGDASFAVRRFWEMPSHDVACELLARGCLWNMFVMIGSLGAFRTLLQTAVPEVARAFELVEAFRMARAETVEEIYRSLPSLDFSSDVLARHLDRIAVVRVPAVGWTDLGQPARVSRLLNAHGWSRPRFDAAS